MSDVITLIANISLALSFVVGLVDIELVDKTLRTYVTQTWKKYATFILPIRDERDPYLSEYFQWLSDRMEERQAANPRVPSYTYTEAKP